MVRILHSTANRANFLTVTRLQSLEFLKTETLSARETQLTITINIRKARSKGEVVVSYRDYVSRLETTRD